MKNVIAIAMVVLIPVSCNEIGSPEDSGEVVEVPFEEISLPGIDRLPTGGTFQVVVRTQAEYEQLIDERFHERLNGYCNKWFPEIRQELEERHSGLPSGEIQRLLNEICIERVPVLKGLEDVEHPEIDFSQYTLLGQDAHGSGCRQPDYDINLTTDGEGNQYRFHVLVTQYGLCEMALDRNLWIIAPGIPRTSEVVFEKDYRRLARDENSN